VEVSPEPEVALGRPRRSWWAVLSMMVLALVAVTVVAGVGYVVWARRQSPEARWCPLVGAADTPIAASPGGAFQAWFARSGPADAVAVAAEPPADAHVASPSLSDFAQRHPREWEWRFSSTASVDVQVSHTPVTGGAADGWTVSGVNQCTYGHHQP
jgi:nitrate reductase NapE component